MRFLREIVNDKWSGGVFGALLVLSLAFQLVLLGRTAAGIAAVDPLKDICSSAPDGAHRPAAPDHSHECPCAELCAAGVHLASPPPTKVENVSIRFAERAPAAVDPSAPVPFRPALQQRHARGPPATSTPR